VHASSNPHPALSDRGGARRLTRRLFPRPGSLDPEHHGHYHHCHAVNIDHRPARQPATGQRERASPAGPIGLSDYFLGQGAPKALAAWRAAEHTPAGYVPSPNHFADYLQSLPAGGNGLWLPITDVRQIQPGDLIIMEKPSTPGATFAGHAMIAASAPLLLASATSAVNVFDSTCQTHGPDDSRAWDTRTTR
jgi:hypothetical protein